MKSCEKCIYHDLELLEYPCSVCSDHSEWSQKRKLETPEHRPLSWDGKEKKDDIIDVLKNISERLDGIWAELRYLNGKD